MSADPALAQGLKPASDVIVVNTPTAPVPVNVVNPPSVEPFEPVALDSFMDYASKILRTTREFHTVLAGKWLVIEQVFTFSSMEVPNWPAFFFLVVTDPPGDPFSRVVEHTMAVDDRQTNRL